MGKNYFPYHIHSYYSSCVSGADSATSPIAYIDRFKELGMKSVAFSEHGCIFNWFEKKDYIEKSGMKYVHAVEAYVTESKDKKVRDNCHTVLIARNYDGVKEINSLVSKSFNRDDGHFYYSPRITFDELCNVSDNIITTSACLASVLGKGSDEFSFKFIEWMCKRKNLSFLEIQHHNVERQKEYNKYLYALSQKTGLKLVAGTDTHSLNKDLADARIILQKAKGISFNDEAEWDLTLKSYDELVRAYTVQDCLPIDVCTEAIDNTNIIDEMVESFELDKSPKYPKMYDNSNIEFRKIAMDSIETHPYALKNHTREELVTRVNEELQIYENNNAVDYMLLKKFVVDYEHKHGIYEGPGRGSVTGSMIAYLIGLTDMDSMKFGLHMFRFINPERISMPDIDCDLYDKDREFIKEYLLSLKTLKTASIVAFTTIALKGAVRDVGRALNIPLQEVGQISAKITLDENKQFVAPNSIRKAYPELFRYADLLSGVVVACGPHPAGVLLSSNNIEEEIGTFTISKFEHPLSCLDMYGLDANCYVKLDLLGLDSVGIVNNTCKLAEIDRVTPDNIPLDDFEVWKDIRDDTTAIFQCESPFSTQVVGKLFSDNTIAKIKKYNPRISYLKLFSLGNALIRPCGASVRDSVMNGDIVWHGIPELDELLSGELGNCFIQEDIMLFVMKFCGYSLGEADILRKKIGKKKNTADLLPEIKERFISFSKEKHNLTDKQCDDIIEPILKCVLDASRYAFSWNHSDAYSFIGYSCGYLRKYYPLEFISTCLNVWEDKEEKTSMMFDYATKNGIKIFGARFRHSRSYYYMDKETNSIYKGMKSIKFLNESTPEELYALRNNKYNNFTELLYDIVKKTSADRRQIKILIKLDFFEEFGNSRFLLAVWNNFDSLKQGEAKQIAIDKIESGIMTEIFKRNSRTTELTYLDLNIKAILSEIEEYTSLLALKDFSIMEKIETQKEYLGYIDLKSNKIEDRMRLVILEMRDLCRKKDGKIWAKAINVMSIGSGKISELTLNIKEFDRHPLMRYDVIKVVPACLEKTEKNGFTNWFLKGYNIERGEI